jgi:hypothetical protein
MNINKKTLLQTMMTGICMLSLVSADVFASLTTTQTQQFLIIATGSGEAFNSDGGEFGANQEVLSQAKKRPGGLYKKHDPQLDLKGKSEIDDKWKSPNNVKNVGISQYLPGAKILKETPDYTGNVAITHNSGKFVTENSDYFAELGIWCSNAANKCHKSNDGDNSWKQSSTDSFKQLSDKQTSNKGGVFQKNAEMATSISELASWKTWINAQQAEYSITNKDISESIYTLDIDQIDNKTDNNANNDNNGEYCSGETWCSEGNNDGFAIIDFDIGGDDFQFQNGNWIIQTTGATRAIFRMRNTKSIKFNNASVMMGCSDKTLGRCMYTDDSGNHKEEYATELGAMFYTDKADSKSFDLSNVVVGGIGLWDLSGHSDGINTNNFQGCTQLVSKKVQLSSTSRLNRCSLAYQPDEPEPPTEVPEPSTLFLFSSMFVLATRLKIRPS